MKKFILFTTLFLTMNFAFSTERTEGATFFILIDKSISMAESKAFDDVQNWLTTDFIPSKLTVGDTVHVYAFYGKVDKVTQIDILTEHDKSTLINKISELKANGPFTDIGSAISSVRKIAQNTTNKNLTTLLLITDLKQEANWPSLYAGIYQFQNRYLTHDKITFHNNNWYEIQISVTEKPDSMAKQLYQIISSSPEQRDL